MPTQATDLQIRKTKLNLSVQTPRPHEGRVQGVRAVGGHQNFDVSTRVKPVQLVDQFQHCPLDLIVPTGSIIEPGTWRGVEKKVHQENAPSMTVFTSQGPCGQCCHCVRSAWSSKMSVHDPVMLSLKLSKGFFPHLWLWIREMLKSNGQTRIQLGTQR